MKPSENRRHEERYARRIRVRFWRRGDPTKVHSGYTTNVSLHGAFVQCSDPFPRLERIQMEFATDAGGFIGEAIVARSVVVPAELAKVKLGGMGLKFISIEQLMAEVMPFSSGPAESATQALSTETSAEVKQSSSGSGPRGARPAGSSTSGSNTTKSASSGPASRHPAARHPAARHPAARPDSSSSDSEIPGLVSEPDTTTDTDTAAETPQDQADSGDGTSNPARYHPAATPHQKTDADEPHHRVHKTYPIRFDTVEQFRRMFDMELSKGGLFVSTSAPTMPGSRVRLLIDCPGGAQIPCEARVLRVWRPEVEGGGEQLVGMAVQFTDKDRAVKRLSDALEQATDNGS